MKKIVFALMISLGLAAFAVQAFGANEPLTEKWKVVKTNDGRILIVLDGASAKEQSSACAARAQTLISELLPYAEALASHKIDVAAPETAITVQVGLTDKDPLAVWNGGEPGHGSISIFTDFCRQSAAGQRVTISHELGHAIEGVIHPDPLCVGPANSCRATNQIAEMRNDMSKPWGARRGEIAATAWAIAIYKRAGLPIAELEEQFARNSQDYWPAVLGYETKRN